MSWQGYVDQSLCGTGKIDKAAIFSKEGDSVWATSDGFSIKPEEIQRVLGGFKDYGSMFSNGMCISGEKYVTIKAEDGFIIGKLGKQGIICAITNQALLVAHHPETYSTQDALTVVSKLKDYLIGVGY